MLTGMLFLLGGILFLWQGADLLVKNSSRLAASFGIPKIIIGLTLVALGTSTPELVVSVLAALRGSAMWSVPTCSTPW
jgi:cation:H+ antiporter